MVALNLSKAVDTVNHTILFEDIEYTAFRVRNRISLISLELFNVYLSCIPHPLDGIDVITYADDCMQLESGPIIDEICNRSNAYLVDLTPFFQKIKKSTATLFTTYAHTTAICEGS